MSSESIATVASIHRYPVKSLGGERLEEIEVTDRGLELDRQFALYDGEGKIGSGKNTRRFRRLDGLLFFAGAIEEGEPVITLPSGEVVRGLGREMDERLSAVLDTAVSLRRESDISHFDRAAIHLLTDASLAWLDEHTASPCDLDPRRFRGNLVLRMNVPGAARAEDGWVGATLLVGEVELTIHERAERCVMTTMAQPELPEEPAILHALARNAEARLGVYGSVARGGRIRVGDAVVVRA